MCGVNVAQLKLDNLLFDTNFLNLICVQFDCRLNENRLNIIILIDLINCVQCALRMPLQQLSALKH